ncbi:outer membrane protein transport protein [bacterium]|nr:outer membrane protein transport protein [bacterium]
MTALRGSLIGAAMAALLATPALAGNGIEDIGTTIRELGRGGTFIGAEGEVGSMMGNPAALAWLRESELYLDGRLWQSQLDYSGALNGIGQKENYVVPNIGYAAPVDCRLSWGLGVFTTVNSSFRVTDYDLSLLGAPAGTTDRSSTKVRFAVITPSIAYKLSDDTAIGASLHYTNGSADFQGYNILGDTLGYSLNGPSGSGHMLRLGLSHRADEQTTLGAYWRSRSHLDISGGDLAFGALTPTPGVVIPETGIEGFQFPEQYGVGIRHEADEEWTWMADYRRLLWSGSGETISFVPSQGPPLGLAMDWSDQDVYALGAEYNPGCGDDTWRFGLNYAASPVPDSTLSPLYPAISEWHYTMGWEGEVADNLSLLTGAVYSPSVSRSSAAGNPFNDLLGMGQPFQLSLDNLELGIGLSWKLGSGGSGRSTVDNDCDGCHCKECCDCECGCGAEGYGALEE